MRGISPVVAFIMLVAIGLLATLAIYYWLIGETAAAPSLPHSNVDIQVHAYNSSRLRITNIGAVNTTEFSAMETTAGDCTFDSATVLIPGVTHSCSLAAATTGEVRVWASGVNSASIYL
ncbi:hypothetical protein ACFLQ2_04435 [archaeon]